MTFSPTIGEWFISSTIFGAAARKGQVIMVKEAVLKQYGKSIAECTDREIYDALLTSVNELAAQKESNEGKRKLYYISAEFLIGKLLSNNLINLGLYDEVKAELNAAGRSLAEIEEIEPEPSLGNGGLGRLAACFLDSIASLGLNGDGVGLNYHFGLFKQEFKDNLQYETKNPWIDKKSWLNKTDVSYKVKFGGMEVTSRMYDILVTGYNNRTNKLHLFDIETIDESIVKEGIDFDKAEIKKNLTLFLYPDDSDEAGRLLRVYQQYFMVSNAAQLILKEAKERGCKLTDLHEYVAIQINDTHPSMVIPELIRLLTAEGMSMDAAIKEVTNTCAYTNHTILAEALEKWPIAYLKKAVPQLMPIIKELDKRVRAKFDDESVYIIDEDDRVHMAHMDIHYGYSVNGVAYLHTEILKDSELNNFYKIYPEKFNNKTNGITQRRFLLHGNPLLAEWVTKKIGDDWITDLPQISKLKVYADDELSQSEFMQIKYRNKIRLAEYIKEHNGIDVDPRSIFDVQVKRLHEYKRQLLNILHVMYLYNQIKEHPEMDFYPRTFIFGAKAAAGYKRAKATIKLINNVANVINNDKSIDGKIKVVFIENYRVSNAEIIFAAADVSEQISTASKEASGTGNMKFMLNGALTLGTMDGANVEIVNEVGADNAVIFGLSADEVIRYENEGGYNPMDIFNNDQDIRQVLMQLINGFYSPEDPEMFREIYDSLLHAQGGNRADVYFILKDFRSYADAQKKIEAKYRDTKGWARSAMLNTACSGKFTSDRTIEEYVHDIWHLDKVKVELTDEDCR